MNKTAVMKDPYYVPILQVIESGILKLDRKAQEAGISINDSQVRSILTKVRKTATGSAPVLPGGSPRENLLVELHGILVTAREGMVIKEALNPDRPSVPLTTADWILCLQTVEESIKRRSAGPGSRDYLEFIARFLTIED